MIYITRTVQRSDMTVQYWKAGMTVPVTVKETSFVREHSDFGCFIYFAYFTNS